jgi:hypothetical protein
VAAYAAEVTRLQETTSTLKLRRVVRCLVKRHEALGFSAWLRVIEFDKDRSKRAAAVMIVMLRQIKSFLKGERN